MNNRNIKLKIVVWVGFVFIATTLNAQKLLTIDDAIRTAMNNNFEILLAANTADISKVNNTLGNAGILPTVELIGSGSYGLNNSNQKMASGTNTNYPNFSSSSLSAAAQLNWNLYDGGKMFVTKSKLNEIQALGEIQFKDKVLQTLFKLVTAYYDVVRQKQQLKSIQEALSFNKERLTISQAGFNAGSLLKTDLLQAKIDLNVMIENVINQEFEIDLALKELNVLLGVKSDELFEIPDSIPLNSSFDKTVLLQKINNSNTNILGFQKQIKIAQLALKENRSLFLPTLNFKAGYSFSQTTNSAGTILQNNLAGPQVGGTLSIPIYSAGETKRKVNTAKIEAESVKINLENIKLQLNTELQNNFTEYENQQKLLKIEAENNQLAKENIQISLDRMKHGQANSLEVHQAQESYVQSSTRLINFRYNLKIVETKLKQLVSEL